MKIRDGFVSNSSSSSFTIPINKLSALQMFSILNHRGFAGDKAWNVEERGRDLVGSTSSHRFDMESFLRNLGIKDENIIWEHT